MAKDWEKHFPNLGNWQESSPRTQSYNCIAFAAGETARRWEPSPPNTYYWPDGAPKDYRLESFIAAFETVGYQACSDGKLESGIEKIAIYVGRYGGCEHAARQLPDGKWTSKIGSEEDIIHEAPESLTSDDYGRPVRYMARARAEQRKQEDLGEQSKSHASASSDRPIRATDIANPSHREDFNRLLGEAARKHEQED